MKASRVAASASSLLLGAALALTGTGAAQADSSTTAVDYVALGDSYSSGVGAGAYDGASGSCKRTPRAYPALWAAANAPSSFAFTACSGARTTDVTAGQLGPLNSGTDLVSLTVGGNDAGFADVMTTCVTQSEATCIQRVNTARGYVDTTLPGRLDTVYRAIRGKAPAARVVVLGYPRFYKLGGSCIAGLTENERRALNDAADHLNATTAKRAADHGFTFGDVVPTFTGHEICSGAPWLHSVNWLNIGESYHPTAAGQSGGYLPVLESAA
ncbi:SGNH/GDSL hydrolase family protein [Streptomyces somaliensis DSM 40738]|uniref:triacylglycerol lipase n=1 Tax=Streptomyces somaliensis (strain ATCC 33201 / DSM 40738 / JCM 12659 / KCTC 9044 / NCTC 11332 / NRRL B-12077 / IP 733) TaxID=1134445 RepID=A0AA44IES2_STRE0|nr:SGNH/GDSL hydrolase family protein [Streptomyces somaliensis]MCQ0022127.1 SGNH/GDSL hydrolase family protein [Streptomyces somaliensis DSM 40738]NKY16060.1 SGNH/GDSL hydrolase family protein [Streptomyces somaliensis DSM 40738]